MKIIGLLLRSPVRVRSLLIISCSVGLTWNAGAATRTAGLTVSGSAVPPEGGLLRLGAANNLAADEDSLRCVVFDPAKGYAWFGASTSPGQVIKVAFDGTNSVPRRIASLILEPGEDLLFTGVIDTNAGYAYFGTDTSPGRVVKVSLGTSNSPPVRIGAVTLASGENELYASVIDPAAGYAYFATRTLPVRVVKIGLGAGTNAPTRVAANTLLSGDGLVRSAVIDPAAGYAWFGTFSIPGNVVKVALGASNLPPQRVDAVVLEPGEDKLTSAVIDRAAGQAWFGTYTSPGRVVKITLGNGGGAPSRLAAVTLNSGEDYLASATMSAVSPGNAFFSSDAFPGMVTKVALDAGTTNAPTRVGATSPSANEDYLVSAGDLGGALFFGSLTQPGQVVQVGAGASGQPPLRQSALTLGRGENELQSVVIDAVNGYGWFGTATFPGQVIKVKLGKAGQPPQRIAALVLEPGEDRPVCAVADVAGGYAWFGTGGGPARVVKVALGSGDSPPTRVGAVTLNSDERSLRCAVIDLTNRYAYFGTAVFQSLGRVVKVALGDSNNPPTRVAAVSLNADEWDFESAVIDGSGTYALFGTSLYFTEATGVGKVVKVALGSGTNAPTRVGALTLTNGEAIFNSAVSDPATGYAWFGAAGLNYTQGQVIKVSFEAGNAAPRRVGAALLSTNESPLNGAVIDVPGLRAFRQRHRNGARGQGRLGRRRGSTGARGGNRVARQRNRPALCRGRSVERSRVVRHEHVAGQRRARQLFAERVHQGNAFCHDGARCFDRREFLLAPCDGPIASRALCPQRHQPQSALALRRHHQHDGNGWINVPVSQGSPTSLQLIAGTNDLCWQVDSTADVPSYIAGAAGDGFRQPADFGAFPTVLTEGTNNFETTSETWASYISYDIPLPVITSIVWSNDTVTLVWISNPGTWYEVQCCTNLLPPAWSNAGPAVQATNTTTQWSETGASTVNSRYYRLKLP